MQKAVLNHIEYQRESVAKDEIMKLLMSEPHGLETVMSITEVI